MVAERQRQQREQNRADAVAEIHLIWEALTDAARLELVVEYQELQMVAGVGFRTLLKRLDAIYYYCKHEGFPPLPVLAISQSRPFVGQPGEGYLGIDIPMETKQVHNFDWSSVFVPEDNNLFI